MAAMLLLCLISASSPADLISQAMTDLRVLYLFERPEQIDWPTLFYLNDEYGCRLDLISVGPGSGLQYHEQTIDGQPIFLRQYQLGSSDTTQIDSLLAKQFEVRRPDLVIIGETGSVSLLSAVANRISSLPPDTGSIFNIAKVYRYAAIDSLTDLAKRSVTLGRRELFEKYRERMQLEIPQLFPWLQISNLSDIRLMRYELLSGSVDDTRPDPDFFSGLDPLRLLNLFDQHLNEGAVKTSFITRARIFLTFFEGARRTVGAQRVSNLVTGYKALVTLADQIKPEKAFDQIVEFEPYMGRLLERAQVAVLKEIGMDWQGAIVVRDSPHGPRLKFRAALTVSGPKEIELSFLRFQPYWDSLDIVLDSISRKIPPHQSYVREYLLDIDRQRLEATMPESLVFAAEIVYGVVPLKVTTAVPIWESPDLKVEFHPGFFFVPPVARLEVDRVVAAMNWKAVISKPQYYHGTATLDLETPRGVFAGAYSQERVLEKGRATETVRIPFSVSNLFEGGIQKQTITLAVEGKQVAADTGIIRIAACKIDDRVTVGLMPDTTGLLEDILRMSGANYRPLTDRSLRTGDLDAYGTIMVGSGALREYPSFRLIKGRLEDYLHQGGSLVVFGQPTDWPEGALPVSLVPSLEKVYSQDLLNRLPQANLTNGAYTISTANLFDWFETGRLVGAAVVSPTEEVIVTPTGATLLSVSRLGEGQIIFCGLPLVQMISELNLEAIHLLANILNY